MILIYIFRKNSAIRYNAKNLESPIYSVIEAYKANSVVLFNINLFKNCKIKILDLCSIITKYSGYLNFVLLR